MQKWVLRAATRDDVEAIADVKVAAMRPDLERLGRFDEPRVRQNLRDGFSDQHTNVIEVDGRFAGSITVRPTQDGLLIEHFYLAAEYQGRGYGTEILRGVLQRADADSLPIRLTVMQGSAARALYERHGFTLESQDPIDVFMIRHPLIP